MQLLKQFVVCADEVHRLQTGKDPECLLAQKVFEQGHYAGRTRPTNTRQGTYATAPSGVMLASINSNNPQQMADMLRRALQKWNSMSESERMLGSDPKQQKAAIKRAEDMYPADGLVVRVFSRDVLRQHDPSERWAKAWNQSFAWFRKDEARAFVPQTLTKGQKIIVPKPLVSRLAMLNFIDNVRGQTSAYNDPHVALAHLESEVVAVSNGVATLRFTGETKTDREGVWSTAGFQDMSSPQANRLGVHLKLLGNAKFDVAKSQFTQFEIVAVGLRHGATQYNQRNNDRGPAPIGFYVVKGGGAAVERVAPDFWWRYGWR